jgi:hypothetical protein
MPYSADTLLWSTLDTVITSYSVPSLAISYKVLYS